MTVLGPKETSEEIVVISQACGATAEALCSELGSLEGETTTTLLGQATDSCSAKHFHGPDLVHGGVAIDVLALKTKEEEEGGGRRRKEGEGGGDWSRTEDFMEQDQMPDSAATTTTTRATSGPGSVSLLKMVTTMSFSPRFSRNKTTHKTDQSPSATPTPAARSSLPTSSSCPSSSPSATTFSTTTSSSSSSYSSSSQVPTRQGEVSFAVTYGPSVRRARSNLGERVRHGSTDADEQGRANTSASTDSLPCLADDEEDLTKRPEWVPDEEAPECHGCARRFTFFKRRHHCRACGGVFCGDCSTNRITIPRLDYATTEVRVCDQCWVREAELRYRKPASSRSMSSSLSSLPSLGRASMNCALPSSSGPIKKRQVRTRRRRQSLSESDEVRINNNILKRSLRTVSQETTAPSPDMEAQRRAPSDDGQQ